MSHLFYYCRFPPSVANRVIETDGPLPDETIDEWMNRCQREAELRTAKKSLREIASEVGVSTATVHRQLKKVA